MCNSIYLRNKMDCNVEFMWANVESYWNVSNLEFMWESAEVVFEVSVIWILYWRVLKPFFFFLEVSDKKILWTQKSHSPVLHIWLVSTNVIKKKEFMYKSRCSVIPHRNIIKYTDGCDHTWGCDNTWADTSWQHNKSSITHTEV